MKKLRYVLFIIVLFSVVTACSKGPKGLIANKWKLTELTGKDINAEKAKEFCSKVIFNINADGTYEFLGLREGAEKGKWEIDKDGKIFTTTSSDNSKENVNILELTKEQMKLENSGTTMTFAVVK